MITNKKGLCLFLFAADCAPVILFDPVNKAIGAAHSGWLGSVKKIAQKTALKMHEVFNSEFENLQIGIAPSISQDNYEVGDNVTEAVIDSFGSNSGLLEPNSSTGKYHFDIQASIVKQLTEIGVLQKNIEVSEYCTFSRQDLFFSARGKKNTGRFGAGIMLC